MRDLNWTAYVLASGLVVVGAIVLMVYATITDNDRLAAQMEGVAFGFAVWTILYVTLIIFFHYI